MDSIAGIRRPCFIEGDNGLASITGFSGNTKNDNPFFARPLCYGRRGNFRNSSAFSRFYDAKFEQQQHVPHFLESCFLCNKSLSDNKDIFMYRGDTPFCSEECRQEQIEIDEAKEKNWNFSAMKASREKDQKKSSISSAKAQNYPSRTGTVASA